MTSVPYGFDLIEGGNGGIDITKGFSDELKWFTMTNSRAKAGNMGDSINVASMLTSDFVTIEPQDSVRIIFANIVADNYNDLISKTVAIRNKYNDVAICEKSQSGIKITPNPVHSNIYISTEELNSNVNIKIYDMSGQLFYNNNFYDRKEIAINVNYLKSGVYIIKMNDKKVTKFVKF
jgi:hypothetical protein